MIGLSDTMSVRAQHQGSGDPQLFLTAQKRVNLVRRSSMRPTPGKATPTHVTRSSAQTGYCKLHAFPVYYTLP